MALKFRCPKCGEDIVVEFLNRGDPAVCRHCGTNTIVPNTAIVTEEKPDYLDHEHKAQAPPVSTKVEKTTYNHVAKQTYIPKPTIIVPSALGPRDFWEIIGSVFTVYKNNFIRLLIIVGIADAIWFIPLLIGMYLGSPESTQSPTLLMALVFVLRTIAMIVGYPLMQDALVHAVVQQYLGSQIDVVKAYRFALHKFNAPIGALVLSGMAILALIFTRIGIPVAIYLFIIWLFVFPVTLIEGHTSTKALGRSTALVKNNWWRTFGVMATLMIIAFVLVVILELIPYVGSFLGYVFAPPIVSLGTLVLYFDSRVKKEGYTPEQLRAEMEKTWPKEKV